MSIILLKRLFIFIVPAVLLFAAYLSLTLIRTLHPIWMEVLLFLPFAAIAVGMFLSLHFNRGRSLLVFIMLTIFYWSCGTFSSGGISSIQERMIFQTLFIMILFDITLIAFMRERGPFTIAGRFRLGFLAIQACFITWLIRSDCTCVAQFLNRKFNVIPLPDHSLFSLISLIAFCFCFPIMTTRVLIRQSYTNSALLCAMAAIGLVCVWQIEPAASLAFVTAAALSLSLSVLQETKKMAFYDELTDLPSRRALNERLTDLGRRYVIAMLDVDFFKKFNDTYGHNVGDQVLRLVAKKINKVKGGGKSYRYGGEEFTIIFPGKSLDNCHPYLEALRKDIADYKFKPKCRKETNEADKGQPCNAENKSTSVTISIGVASSKEGSTPMEILQEADKAVYRAKQNGRNQISE